MASWPTRSLVSASATRSSVTVPPTTGRSIRPGVPVRSRQRRARRRPRLRRRNVRSQVMAPEDKDKSEVKKTELQDELRSAGESTTGTKDELVERVEDLSKRHVPDVFVAQV